MDGLLLFLIGLLPMLIDVLPMSILLLFILVFILGSTLLNIKLKLFWTVIEFGLILFVGLVGIRFSGN